VAGTRTDFSVQLEMTRDGLKLCGYTGLLKRTRLGQFQGSWAEPHHPHAHPGAGRRLVSQAAGHFAPPAATLRGHLRPARNGLRRADYLGPLGIDAFVYRDASGAMKLKPVVEINPRYTMGRVMVELIAADRSGKFRPVPARQSRAAAHGRLRGFSRLRPFVERTISAATRR